MRILTYFILYSIFKEKIKQKQTKKKIVKMRKIFVELKRLRFN